MSAAATTTQRQQLGSAAMAAGLRNDGLFEDSVGGSSLAEDDDFAAGDLPPSASAGRGRDLASPDEGEMRRHFLDVESSFLPEPSSMAAAAAAAGAPSSSSRGPRVGADDTYLELGRSSARGSPSVDLSEEMAGGRADALASRWSATTGTEAEEVQGEEDGDWVRYGSVDEGASSPAQAAARRGHARNGSSGSGNGLREMSFESPGFLPSSSRPSTAGTRPGTAGTERPISKGSTVRPASPPPQQESSLLSFERASPPPQTSRNGSRPVYLSNRSTGQRSTVSSAGTMNTGQSREDALDAEQGPDFLRRLPSFGSAVSYMDRDGDSAPPLSRGVSGSSILAGMRGSRQDGGDNDDEARPETPRGARPLLEAPTDTVIAQHVQSIQVPDTIARDFRARIGSVSPNKQRPNTTGQTTGPLQNRRTLTLKEQNSKMDKLTKENFDLKLKIHFLDQALQSRSEDGVKELIDQNVQFQTDLANERKESQAMRRKIKELERKLKEQEDSLVEAQKAKIRSDEDEDDPTLQAEMHEEILYLRQQLDHSENRVTTLSEEIMTKEFEKRKLAEHMRSMASTRGRDSAGLKETESMWQDLLQAEQGRREQAEEDVRRLREDLVSLRIERASPSKHRSPMRKSRLDPNSGFDGDTESAGASSVTLVEQLRHENAELRRDLGAQTSMLTSRNRERERLQQEIEDLKLLQRKSDGGRSVAGESIFERSISRAHLRAPSRAGETVVTLAESEREDWEKKEGQLRDQNAELRLKYQELERTHNTHLKYITTLEGDFQGMETELEEKNDDLRALQAERDEALQAYEYKENEYDKLEQEALAEIEALEERSQSLSRQLEDSQKRLQKTQAKLDHTDDSFRGLQGEVRDITQSVMSLEDEKQSNIRTIQALEQQLSELEDELRGWDEKCKEIEQKNRRLEITQESLHSEITFLREEQESDKIKIGELEDAVGAAQQMIQDEQEKLREMEASAVEERQQRDVLENKSKEEVQKVLDDLNEENGKTKDEVRKLRRNLSAKEVESNTWRQKLEDLEQSLREALGDPNGSKQSLLAEIEKLQRDLESTASKMDRTQMELADKERLLRHRDGLLESTSLESRRLSDLLDKERASRKHELEQFERSSKGQATHMRTIAQQETRMMELESSYIHEQRKMASLDLQYREQLHDRNTLLLALWNRLSTLCGVEWAQSNCLVNGENPSVDAIARHLPAFNRNLIAAVKTVESLIGSFKVRIRGVEKDLSRDYQTLEHNLDLRMRRLDLLEQTVADVQTAAAEEAASQQQARVRSTTGKSNEELARLKSEVKVLKAELKFHRQHPNALTPQHANRPGDAAPEHGRTTSFGTGRSSVSPARIVSQLLRHHSSSAVERSAPDSSAPPPPRPQPLPPSISPQPDLALPPASSGSSGHGHGSEQRWVHRLKELEKRLKAEREARLLDRRGARQRLEEGRLENEELRQMLEHERMRAEDLSAELTSSASESRQSDYDNSGVD